MNINKKEFIKLNKKFDEFNKENEKNKSFETIKGKIPILISAPHSVRQIRNGKIKGKDIYTGPIVIILQKEADCYSIYKTKNNNDDANYDIENNTYKEEILKIIEENQIKLLLDIHGASNDYGFGVDIATGEKENLNKKEEALNLLEQILKKHKIENVEIEKIFKAKSKHTICKTIAEKTSIPCIEIEIAKKYRDIENFEEIIKIINALKEYIINIEKNLKWLKIKRLNIL